MQINHIFKKVSYANEKKTKIHYDFSSLKVVKGWFGKQ